ncbi:MAG: hypothetical protein DMF64_11855 [Acidobacteria bacterium]|nr:MAG: hypothetical protein DMF64_11855 [Acidobacteriota bacterium]
MKQAKVANKQERRPKATRTIVNPDALEDLKRRAEDVGLIIHARQPKPAQGRRPKKRGQK